MFSDRFDKFMMFFLWLVVLAAAVLIICGAALAVDFTVKYFIGGGC